MIDHLEKISNFSAYVHFYLLLIFDLCARSNLRLCVALILRYCLSDCLEKEQAVAEFFFVVQPLLLWFLLIIFITSID